MNQRGQCFLKNIKSRIEGAGLKNVCAQMVRSGHLSIYGKPKVDCVQRGLIVSDCVLCCDIIMPADCCPLRRESPVTLYNHCSFYEKHVEGIASHDIDSICQEIVRSPATELSIKLWDDYECGFLMQGFEDMVYGYDDSVLCNSKGCQSLKSEVDETVFKDMIKNAYYRPSKRFSASEGDLICDIVIGFMTKYCG